MAQNLQSEIIFIAKFGGLVLSACAYYFYMIKPLAIFNERQKQNRKDLDKIMQDLEEFKHEFTIIQTEHDNETCKKKKAGRRYRL